MVSTTKTILGKARKLDDIRKQYERFEAEALERGRITGKGQDYIDTISVLMEARGEDRLVFAAVVSYIVDNTIDPDSKDDDEAVKDMTKKIGGSLRAFLKTRGSPYTAELERRVLYILPKSADES